MTVRGRLDAELVRRGLARSREQAVELIAAGRVAVGGQPAAKAATQVATDARGHGRRRGDADGAAEYVSRGGHKLAGALAAFAGLSGGGAALPGRGRVDRRLHRRAAAGGAAHVVAVDVGYGQLAWSLRTDPRVTVLDRINVRALTPAQVAPRRRSWWPTCRSSR